MKTTRRGLFGMFAGLFGGFGAAKAAPAATFEVWAMTIYDVVPPGVGVTVKTIATFKDGQWVSYRTPGQPKAR